MTPPDPTPPTYEELAAQNARVRQQVAELAAKSEAALVEIERLKRSGKRQATPVSKSSRSADPGKPGRKPGEGPFRFRTAPAPDTITGAALPVPVTRSGCPGCGGTLEAAGSETVWVTDLPPVPPQGAFESRAAGLKRGGYRKTEESKERWGPTIPGS